MMTENKVSPVAVGAHTAKLTMGDFGINHTHTRQYRTHTYMITTGAGSNHSVWTPWYTTAPCGDTAGITHGEGRHCT